MGAIRLELDALSRTYDSEIGAQLAANSPDEPFRIRIQITQDWFTVFNSNAVHIAKLEPDMAAAIVGIYASMKALIELYAINNTGLDRLERIEQSPQRFDQSPQNKPNVDALNKAMAFVRNQLVEHASKMRKADGELRRQVGLFRNLGNP